MSLRLYNTLSRTKEDFVPLDRSNVRLYVCGPTVYDFAHIGNARPVIVFDVLFRLLRHHYGAGHVTYVRNVTDVDDKINERAARDFPGEDLNAAIRRLTEGTAAIFSQDVAALGCLPPTVEPRATEHIAEMIAIIERLIAGGHAYAAEGHVLFNVPSMADYGRLSRRSLDEMEAGARVDVAPYKRDPMDFVLWKPSAAHEPGWTSPWGRGRPGWHIECSAMSWKHLGEVFDIHGGGIDLVFPHHENEIAQTRCAFGHDAMARVWMHNGFLQVEGEKMSKSLGNFFTIRELLTTDRFGGRAWHGEVLRLAMLRTHYRQPIDWTLKALEEAEATLLRWKAIISRNQYVPAQAPPSEMISALGDDLNTPKALNVLHELGRAANGYFFGGGDITLPDTKAQPMAVGRFIAALELLGFTASGDEIAGHDAAVRGVSVSVDTARVDALLAARTAARAAKNFAESDRLRDELASMGVAIKDGKDASGQPVTTWELKR